MALREHELESENAKTQGREFLPKMPPLGFRVLEFEDVAVASPKNTS
ncbi:hypothetical protein ACEN17_09435 [Corynebacterium rouxii]